MIIVPTVITLEILAALIDTAAEFDGAKIKLWHNDYVPTKDSVIADFTICDFTGYATSSAIVWGGPLLNGDGEPVILSDLKLFTGGTPFTVSNTVYGYMVTDGAGTKLLWSERFDNAIIVAATGQTVPVIASFGAENQAA